ncbi:MAG: DUF4212 domain-containing protein [Planctomycetota bacterium]|nr:DUF4212 domain-containing protein [Planctomycetota bacterium]
MTTKVLEVNFFKPVSLHAKRSVLLISISVIVWAVAVFGFQFLLIALNEPTPEPALAQFEEVWPSEVTSAMNVEEGMPSTSTRQQFTDSLLMVLGKNIAVKDEHKKVLVSAFSATLLSLLGDGGKEKIAEYVDVSEKIRISYDIAAEVSEEQKQKLFATQKRLQSDFEAALGLARAGSEPEGFDKLKAELLPMSVAVVDNAIISKDVVAQLPGIMDLYLIHNRNVLTDTTFIGFPFHYWYTAQFLLILFVLICLVYSKMLDRNNTKYGFEEDPEEDSEEVAAEGSK